MQRPIKSINSVTDLYAQLSKEINLFTLGDGTGEYLQAAYSYLGTILPTSVDCEWCFLTAPYVNYKIHLDDRSDALIFLKNYLKQFWNPNNFLKTNVFAYV